MKLKQIIAAGLAVCTIASGGGAALAAQSVAIDDVSTGYTVQAEDTISLPLSGTNDYTKAYQLLNDINAKRKAAKLPELTMDLDLLDSAMQRAAECNVLYSHKRPNGASYVGIVTDSYGVIAESIAYGKSTAADVAKEWTERRADSGNMLNDDFTSVGIGCFYQADGSVFWAAIFTDQTPDEAVQPKNRTGTVSVSADMANLGSITLSMTAATLAPGETAQAKLYVRNNELTSGTEQKLNEISCAPTVEYSSNNTAAATVSADGTVKAVKNGTATITATVVGTSISASQTLKVSTPFNKRTPKSVTLANRSKGIKVSWKAVTGATQYVVYRSTNGDGFYAIKRTENTSWTDKTAADGTRYQYKVIASNGKTNSKESTAKTMIRLSSVSLQSVSVVGETSIKVRWTPNTRAEGYEIQYANASTGEVKSVKVGDSSRKSKTIKGIQQGAEYQVRICSYRTRGSKTFYSGWSTRKTVQIDAEVEE